MHPFNLSPLSLQFFLNTMVQDELCFSVSLADTAKQTRLTIHCVSAKDKRYWTALVKKSIVEFYTAGNSSELVASKWQEQQAAAGEAGWSGELGCWEILETGNDNH